MKQYAQIALDHAKSRNVEYADIRVVELKYESIALENCEVEGIEKNINFGIGVRVLKNGAWGFAANPDLAKRKIEKAVDRAIEVAEASARSVIHPLKLKKPSNLKNSYYTNVKKDPFLVPISDKVDYLMKCEKIMNEVKGISFTSSGMGFKKEKKLFMNTSGAELYQEIVHSGGYITAYSRDDNGLQKRSFPSSHRGKHLAGGYEIIENLNMIENAGRIAEEAVALLTAPECPNEEIDLILGKTQLALQVHESCGHASELDRIFGMEANYAGTSFMKPEHIGKFVYGSEIVNIVSDPTYEGALGTYAWDDEGIPAKLNYLIKDGIINNFLSSIETAERIGLDSTACMRASSWNQLPIVRMANVNLLPGKNTLEEIISSTENGMILEDNSSWSIDDKRLNFQFGAEIGRIVKNGKIKGIIKNPTYSGITPKFWNSCDMISDKPEIFGTCNCGKGQPTQIIRVGHVVPYARFKNVKVGVRS